MGSLLRGLWVGACSVQGSGFRALGPGFLGFRAVHGILNRSPQTLKSESLSPLNPEKLNPKL